MKKAIFNYLVNVYYNYYNTVYYTYIEEAIENTIKDLKIKESDLLSNTKDIMLKIHNHIKENYI